jgi:hypothetical protein
MDLQKLASIDPLLKHQWPDIGSMFELHRRDTAVFVSLSSRTNTRWGVLVTLDTRSKDRVVR